MLKRAIQARTSRPGLRGVLETLLGYVTEFLNVSERLAGEARRCNVGPKPAAGNGVRHITAFHLLQAKFMRETPTSPKTRRREVGGLSAQEDRAPPVKKHSRGEGGVCSKPPCSTGLGKSRRSQVSGGSSVQKMVARFSAVMQKERKESTQENREKGSAKQLGRSPLLSSMIGKFEGIATVRKGSDLTFPKIVPKPNLDITTQGAKERERYQDSEKLKGEVSEKEKKGCGKTVTELKAKIQDSWLQNQEVPELQVGPSKKEPLYSSKAMKQSRTESEVGVMSRPAKSTEVFSHPPTTNLTESLNIDPFSILISPSGLPQHQAHGLETRPAPLPLPHLSSTADPVVHSTEPLSKNANPDYQTPHSQVPNLDYQGPDSQVSNTGLEAPNPQVSKPGFESPNAQVSNPGFEAPTSQVPNPDYQVLSLQVSNPNCQVPDSQISNPGFEAPNSQISNSGFEAPNSQISNSGYDEAPNSEISNSGFEAPNSQISNSGFEAPNSQISNSGFEAPNSQISNSGFEAPNSQISNSGFEAPNSQISNPGFESPNSLVSNSEYQALSLQVSNPDYQTQNSQVSKSDYQAPDSQVSNPGFEAPDSQVSNPGFEETNSQVSNPDVQVPDSQVFRGLILLPDLSFTTDKTAARPSVQLPSYCSQQPLPKYAFPRTSGPLNPERDCTTMSAESHNEPPSAEVTFHSEQPSDESVSSHQPKTSSPLTNPKTAPLPPPSEPPSPKPVSSSQSSRDLSITTAPSTQPSENLYPKTTSPLPPTETLALDTSDSSLCTHQPPSPGESCHMVTPGDQVTAGEEQFPRETRRGGDMRNGLQSKRTLEINQVSSEELFENNPPDYYHHSNQTTANQNPLLEKEHNGGPNPRQKYRTRNYAEKIKKEPFKPKTIRFADSFTF